MAVPASRLFDYRNRQALDDLRFNAFASDGSVNKPRIPPEIIYLPFQEFLHDVSRPLFSRTDPRMIFPQNSPPANFFQYIPELLRCVAARYTSEQDYTAALNVCFSNLLGVQIEGNATPRPGTQRKGQTDGGFLLQTLVAPRLFVLIRTDKLGSGSGGGDSLVELLGHMANIVAADPQVPIRPTIFVEVVGHRLIVSIAALDENNSICLSPAVVNHSMILQAMPSLHYAQLASIFCALRRLIVAIAFHATTTMPAPLVLEANRVGHNLVFNQGNGNFEKYLRQGEPYGREAHQWCTDHGLAPSFSESSFPGWTRITMTAVGGTWESALGAAHDRRPLILSQVQRAVQRMNDAGFVHGDVRASNSLFQVQQGEDGSPPDTVRILFLDFDGAGRKGQAFYSLLPFNPAVPTHPEAFPGGEATAAHDQWRAATEANFFV